MSSKTFRGIQLRPDGGHSVDDCLPIEAVLQIKVNGAAYTTTVRTPGADRHLARGLLFTEGVITNPAANLAYRAIIDPDTDLTGCLEVTAHENDIKKELQGRRSAMGSASCGLCGIREPEELTLHGGPIVSPPEKRIDHDTITRLLHALPMRQPLFEATGGVHGAMAFTADGTITASHEDVGRHNAVDKVIGELLGSGQLSASCGVVVSGRLSYEIVFKAFQAGWPYLISVSAPTSLSVEMGERFGLCVIGFCRDQRATVYSHQELVRLDTAPLLDETPH